MSGPGCVFCHPEATGMQERIIRSEDLFFSVVSRPSWRERQCLVVPARHIVRLDELSPDESVAVMGEVGRLSLLLDEGCGTGVMQKFQPLQAENGVKVSHLHVHVFPRFDDDVALFPVPEPNNLDGFYNQPLEEAIATAEELR